MTRARIWPRCARSGCGEPQLGDLPFCAWHWRIAKVIARNAVNDLLLARDDLPAPEVEARINAIRVELETP